VDWVTPAEQQANPSIPMVANHEPRWPVVVRAECLGGQRHHRRRELRAWPRGTNSANACNNSPSSTPTALTVAATTTRRRTRLLLGFRTCVEPVSAPGTSITSAWYTSNNCHGPQRHSMAYRHVAGAAAPLTCSCHVGTPAMGSDHGCPPSPTRPPKPGGRIAGTGSPNASSTDPGFMIVPCLRRWRTSAAAAAT